jgi:hypothetical protein
LLTWVPLVGTKQGAKTTGSGDTRNIGLEAGLQCVAAGGMPCPGTSTDPRPLALTAAGCSSALLPRGNLSGGVTRADKRFGAAAAERRMRRPACRRSLTPCGRTAI